MATEGPSSLIHLVRKSIFDAIDSCRTRWKVLATDGYTKDLIDTVMTEFEILDRGVTQIVLLAGQRSPSPSTECVYILTPTSTNVDLVIRDFAPPQENPSHGRLGKSRHQQNGQAEFKSAYAAANLFWLDAISDKLFQRLADNIPQNQLKSCTELFISFWPRESHVFSLKTRDTLKLLYAPPTEDAESAIRQWEDEIEFMGRSIINVLITLSEDPYIRYYSPPTSFHPEPLGPGKAVREHVSARIARWVMGGMEAHKSMVPDFPKQEPPREKGFLFIVDRSIDPYAPFLHEFTYQAMVNDLLDIEDGKKYQYSFRNNEGQDEDATALLQDAEDRIWSELKHMHMGEALEKVTTEFKKYVEEHGGSANGASLNDMKDMLASLNDAQKMKQKLSLHLSMASQCMKFVDQKKLVDVAAKVEQCCATGQTNDGKTPKHLVEDMIPLLDDRAISTKDKVRIIALYILHRDGVPEEDLKRLFQHARLGMADQAAVNNLVYFGLPVATNLTSKRKPLFKQPYVPGTFEVSRYHPIIKLLLEEHIAAPYKLDEKVFPYMGESPAPAAASLRPASAVSASSASSLRSAKPTWTRGGSAVFKQQPRQKIIVFVAGGVTYSEIRTVYEIGARLKKDIYIGSTHEIIPEKFIVELADLERSGLATMSSSLVPKSAQYTPRDSPQPSREPKNEKKRAAYREQQEQELQSNYDRRFLPSSQSSSPAPTQSYQPAPPLHHAQTAPPRETARYNLPPAAAPSMPTISHVSTLDSGKKEKKGFFKRF